MEKTLAEMIDDFLRDANYQAGIFFAGNPAASEFRVPYPAAIIERAEMMKGTNLWGDARAIPLTTRTLEMVIERQEFELWKAGFIE